METVIALLVGLFLAAAIYLMLSRSLIRILLGIVLLGNAVNLLIFVAGRLTRAVPALIPAGQTLPVGAVANPLPQALILTAIVISFAMFVFLIVLAFRAYQSLDADNTDHMRLAEPDGAPRPPLEY
jgi:multicomponent Na+:H+ antiporter subunit C